jgi:hypothetical protein
MSHTQHVIPMKGNGNQPTFQSHLELHAALVNVVGVGGRIPRPKYNAFIMDRTGVGIRQSVQRYLEAWEDLGLIEKNTWKGTKSKEGVVVLKARPDGLATTATSAGLAPRIRTAAAVA